MVSTVKSELKILAFTVVDVIKLFLEEILISPIVRNLKRLY